MNQKIVELVSSWQVRPSDCCQFADYLVQGLHGISFLPEYNDEEEFLRFFDGDLEAAVSEFVPNPVSPDALDIGDLCLISVLDQQSVGMVVDDNHSVCLFRDGLPRYISNAFIDSGWKLT